jgi:MFS family permease
MNSWRPSISGNIPRLYIIKVAKWFMLTMPILMLFYIDLGLSNEQAFQLKAVYSIAIVIFEIPSGYIADVLGRRTTLILGAFLGTMGFAFYTLGDGFIWFLMAEITLGIGQSFISGADSALLYDSLKHNQLEKKYLRYEGINTSIGNFSEAFGAIIGGALAEISLRTPFFWQTGIAFLAIPAALTLVEPPTVSLRLKPGLADIVRVIKYALVTNKHLRWNLVYSSVIGAATLTMAWVYQLQLHNMDFGEFEIGATATILNLLLGFVTLRAYIIEN